jgi:phosphoribosyl 1,2-cyclic phosphodiesterase
MNKRFCVLGSGSKGNAVLVCNGDSRLLIDAGFQPDELSQRLRDACSMDWEGINALLLTHTHGDHIKKSCLQFCVERQIHFWCHQTHAETLAGGKSLRRLRLAERLHFYGTKSFSPAPGVDVNALNLSHDSPPTFGFRLHLNGAGESRHLGYAADLGCWDAALVAAFADADALALEFNHDEERQRRSGRPEYLIRRVLGPRGHLSNRQAARLLQSILSVNKRLRTVVQLHLSNECNDRSLAYAVAQQAVEAVGASVALFTSRQERAGRMHELSEKIDVESPVGAADAR